MAKTTEKLFYQVDPFQINFIDMIIKAYEGIGIVNVDHQNKGRIWIEVTAGTKLEVKEVMRDLGQQFEVEYLGENRAD